MALLAPAAARANGAFPDSFKVFAPADRPQEILLATNFGLISSADGGHAWQWVCEHDDGLFGARYDRAPGTPPRLYAAVPSGLAFTDDGACSWHRSPELEGGQVRDLIVDPSAPGRLWVVAQKLAGTSLGAWQVYLSTDGALTFGPSRFAADGDAEIQGIEPARSQPQRVYLTVRHPMGDQSRVEVVRTDDGGATWKTFDVSAGAHARPLLIAAVDPADADRVYFRLLDFPNEALAISRDGGQTVSVALTVPKGTLTAFLRRADGTLLVGALEEGNRGALYASKDGGQTFARLPATIRPRGLAERAGVVYAATDNNLPMDNVRSGDGFALATSSDGATWQPLIRYADVGAIQACPGQPDVAATCTALCRSQIPPGIFSPALCPTPDGGVEDAGAPPVTPPPSSDGGGCRLGPRAAGAGPGLLLVLLAAGLSLRRSGRRSRSVGRARPPGGAPPAA